MFSELQDFFSSVLKDIYNIEKKDFIFDTTPNPSLWDYSFWCFQVSKDLKLNPNVISNDFKKYFENKSFGELIEKLDFVWPYINIFLNKSYFTKQLFVFIKSYLKKDPDKYYIDYWEAENNKKTIFIDYIWTNVWKPLHIGHICPSSQWQVLINLYNKLWYNVISDSHIWDWWIIFWKLIYAYKIWWDEKKLKENAVEHLFDLYVRSTKEADSDNTLDQKFRDEFKNLSSGDLESIKLWKSFTSSSIESMQKQLSRLNIKPSYNIWESFYEWLNLPKLWDYPDLSFNMAQIVNELIEKGIAVKNQDDSVWVNFPEDSKIPSTIIQKKDWTFLYLTSDLACIKYRLNNWDLSKIIYFVDVRQSLHFKQVFYISKLAWWIEDENSLIFAWNWFLVLKDGAMSTRKWKIIKLEKLLDEAESRSKDIIKSKRSDLSEEKISHLSKIIWIWAVKYGYLKKSRESDVVFDWDEFLTFDWNSWPYLQYSYVRALKVLNKNDFHKHIKSIENVFYNSSFLKENEDISLIKIFLDYKNIINETAEKNMPHVICSYCFTLTKYFNSFYNRFNILSEKDEDTRYLRLLLVYVFTLIIEDIFSILWIDLPDEM